MRNTIVFFSLIMIILFSCKKIESYSDEPNRVKFNNNFFNYSVNIPENVKVVLKKLKAQNSKNGFVNRIPIDFGYPDWTKAIVVNKNRISRDSIAENDIILIPFSDNGQFVSAILVGYENNQNINFEFFTQTYLFNIAFNSAYSKDEAEKLLALFYLFENHSYGKREFSNLPNRLYNEIVDNDTLPGKDVKIEDVLLPQRFANQILICITYVCALNDGGNNLINPCSSIPPWTICYTLNINVDNDGNGTVIIPTTGGSGPTTLPPCVPTTLNWYDKNAPSLPQNPCSYNPNQYNPYHADTVIIDTSISNNFPCVSKLLDTLNSYYNSNVVAQVMLSEIFGVNKKIQARIEVDWGLSKDSADAYVDPASIDTSYFDQEFYPVIKLNPWVLENSTNIYIASTILHEIVHAYIDYMGFLVLHGVISAQVFANMFPIYWPVISSHGNVVSIPLSSQQHNVMAYNIHNLLSVPLQSFSFDSSITVGLRDSVIRAISWGGLQKTLPWSSLADTNSIKAFNIVNRDTSIRAPFYSDTLQQTIFTHDSKELKMKCGCN